MAILRVTEDPYNQKIVITDDPIIDGVIYTIFDNNKKIKAVANTKGIYPFFKDNENNIYLIGKA